VLFHHHERRGQRIRERRRGRDAPGAVGFGRDGTHDARVDDVRAFDMEAGAAERVVLQEDFPVCPCSRR